MSLKLENSISEKIIGAAIEVHRELGGPGLLESVYEEALIFELNSIGLQVERQLEVPLNYKGQQLDSKLRLDLLVEGKVVVELKALSEMNSIHKNQLLTYVRLMKVRLGLIINFGQPKLVDGVSRVLNNTL